MAFNGKEGEQITLQEGSQMTANYRAANPGQTLAHFMGKDILNAILNQSGCVGIRTYYALSTTGSKEIVMVGVNNNGDDMTTGIIADRSFPCPTACGNPNPLNS